MTVLNLAQAIGNGLHTALADDPTTVVMGEDVGRAGGVFRVTDGLQATYGNQRVIDTPVAESGIVGAAFGMAVAGMNPIVEMQFMGFSYPAFDQIVNHVARIRNRSRHRFIAPMTIRIPFGGGFGAAEHHSESMEAIYAHTPGLKVVVPSTPYDAKGLLLAAIADRDPVIFLEPIRLYRSVSEEVPDESYEIEIGVARVTEEGSDVTLISYGAMMKETRAAATQLEDDGVSVEVIDLRTLVPLDVDTIITSVEKTGRAVVINEAARTCGFTAEVAAEISARALYSLEAPVERVTGWDTVFPLKRGEHLYLPGVDRIVAAARRTLNHGH